MDERTLFGMAVTLQGLSCKDSNLHEFLRLKGERVENMGYGRVKCVFSFSKYLADGHCAVWETTVSKADAITCPRGAFFLKREADKQNDFSGRDRL